MAKKKTFSEATINTVRRLVPIDDAMFQKMCEDRATCQEIISTILNEQVKVISVVPQSSIGNLQGRAVRLDALCELSDGTYVNVEVQKPDNDDHEGRVWYNASVITSDKTPKRVKFKNVKRVIAIYISQFDIFGDGYPIYHIDRVVRETQKVRKGKLTEIYVNAAVKKRDTELNRNVSDLMDLFTDRDTFNYDKFPSFSNRKNVFTNTEKGELEMCEKVDQLVKQTRLTDLFVYTERGLMTLKNAAVAAELTPKEFRTQMQMNGYTVPQKTRKSPSSSVE